MFNRFFSRSSYLIYSGMEKAPADPAVREALWVDRSSDVQINKICCLPFRLVSDILTQGSILDPRYDIWE